MTKQHTLFRDLPLLDTFEQQSAQDWLPLEITQLFQECYQGQLRELQHNGSLEHQNCMVHKRGNDEHLCTVSFFRSTNGVGSIFEYNAIENSLFFFFPSGNRATGRRRCLKPFISDLTNLNF